MTVRHRAPAGRASRRIALLGALALLLALVPFGGTAFADHFENTEVLDADNAVEAALNWSEFTFDSATDAALGRDDIFADNLASSVIQGTMDAPLLLTPSGNLEAEVLAELERLGVDTVHVLGGDEAIDESVVAELEAEGFETHRDAGITRIETAIDIAATHAANATSGLLVRAFGGPSGDETQAWADALAAGGWAAEEEIPVFLTQSNELNDNLRAYLEDSDITNLTIVGGTSAVSAAVAAELEAMGITVDRVSGANRFATAVEIAEARGFADAGDATTVILSEGQQANAWAGGFAAAAYSAISGAPIVLSNGANIPPETETWLEGADQNNPPALVCGPFVEDAACDEAAQILGQEPAPHTNQDLTVTPQETAVNTVSDNAATTTANRGSRTYTVTGLDNAKTYDLELHEAEDVNIDADGNVTFENASPATTGASFEVVNGANVGTAGTSDIRDVSNVTPQNGTITFTVDSTVPDRVIPVINEDADGDNTLDLEAGATATTPKAPTENFGVGGEKEFITAEAEAGTLTTVPGNDDNTVVRVNKAENYFLLDQDGDGIADVTVQYDANDIFRIATTATSGAGDADNPSTCNPVSIDTFEANLSTGDELDTSSIYARDDAASSTLCLEDITPAPVGGVQATELDADSIEVQWGAIDANASEVRVYRKSGACTTTLTDYTRIATLARTATRYQDDGLNASTQYCYAVTQVVDGDESAVTDAANDDATTTAVGATAAPQSTDAYLQTDATFQGEVSAGDVWRIVFDKVMQPVDNGDTIRVQDAQGETLNVVCETTTAASATNEAVCLFNTADVTISGTTYPAGRVLTVTLENDGDFTSDNTVTGANDRIEYPATIINQSGFADVGGRAWTPADDPDHVIDNEGTKTETGSFAAEAVAPDATSATIADGGAGTDSSTVTYTEAVICNGNEPGQFVYDADTTDGVNPTPAATAVTCDGDNTLVLTFPTATVVPGAANDAIIYTQSGTAANRVEDLQRNDAVSPDTVTPTG